MKALLLTLVVLCIAASAALPQKKNTLFGDVVVGELTGKDEATREITVKYPGKDGPEIFSGILADGYKLKTGDESRRDLQLSELVPGSHVRLFYKTSREKVSGQEKKINKISRIDVLGNDEFFRLRAQLNLAPSTTVVRAEKDGLPGTDPLKVFLAVSLNHVNKQLVTWIDKWNRKNGDAFGKLEVAPDLQQADILIAVAPGADTMVVALPQLGTDGRSIDGVWSHATSYLVVKEAERLKLLWTDVAPVFSGPKAEVSPKSTELVTAELEKRLKSRVRNSQK